MSTYKPYQSTYILDDAPGSDREDIPIGIGFELSPDDGHITWITRAAARVLLTALSQSFPFQTTGTTLNIAAVQIGPERPDDDARA